MFNNVCPDRNIYVKSEDKMHVVSSQKPPYSVHSLLHIFSFKISFMHFKMILLYLTLAIGADG